jgi:hypothetical protein
MQARQDKNVGGVYRRKESGVKETTVAIKRWRSRAFSSTKRTYKEASLRETKKSTALWSVM